MRAKGRRIARYCALLWVSLALTACGSGGGDEPPSARSVPAVGSATSTNTAPTIAGSPASAVAVGASYSFTPTAGDSDGDRLLFGIDSKPSWATFDTATGQLSGTPAASDVRTYPGIVIRVTDGIATTALPAFDLVVTSPPVANREPQISGTAPVSVVAGNTYSFTPTASDADAGTTLTFSLNATPRWASFNTATGRLQGTPAAADVGSYTNLVISVSDGVAQRSLPAFTITVEAAAPGTALLGWTPPTQNMDGSVLTNIAGYKLYWGTSPGDYPNSRVEMNAGLTSLMVEGLTSGTYYFVVTAISSSLVESPFSNTATKTIP